MTTAPNARAWQPQSLTIATGRKNPSVGDQEHRHARSPTGKIPPHNPAPLVASPNQRGFPHVRTDIQRRHEMASNTFIPLAWMIDTPSTGRRRSTVPTDELARAWARTYARQATKRREHAHKAARAAIRRFMP